MNRTNRTLGKKDQLVALLCAFVWSLTAMAQEGNNVLKTLLEANMEQLGPVLEHPDRHRVQILYTQIDRDQNNKPSFRSYSFGDHQAYFYPASTIKIYGAVFALNKLAEIKKPGLDKDSFVRIDSSYMGQQAVERDSTSRSGRPSLAHYIKKLLVLSDNDAYNRLYEFLGQEGLNEALKNAGFNQTRLTHRLSIPLSTELNKHSNAMQFYNLDASGAPEILLDQKAVYCEKDYSSQEDIWLGSSHVKDGEVVFSPMNFAKKNYSSIFDLQRVVKAVVFPDESSPLVSSEDRDFLLQYMSQLPRETKHPDYGEKPDNYCKFFLYGDRENERIPEDIRIFNKIGLAYGFTIDNAYVVDLTSGVEFLLTAVVYTNENERLNDGLYEYDELAFPFLGALGRVILDYERQRPRAQPADLSAFKFEYDIPSTE